MRANILADRRFFCGLMVALCVWLAPATAAAQSRANAWLLGARGGVSGDPTQLVVGAHVESPELTAPGRLFFRPAIEAGFGDDLTIVAGHFDILYRAGVPGSSWSLLFGAGPMIAYEKESFEGECDEDFDCGFSDTTGGFSAIVGLQFVNGFSVELRTSDRGRGFQAMVGYTFKKR